jgi:putative ABC transport system permease protein
VIWQFFGTRELKRYPFFFFLLFSTILLGTFGLVGIGFVSQKVQLKLQDRAHELLTSDFAVTARRDLFPNEQKILSTFFKDLPHQKYKVIDIYSMVTHVKEKQARLVEIRAVEKAFPFYGNISVDGQAQSINSGLYISKDLEKLWNISKGDWLVVGDLKLMVSGIVQEDSSLGLRGFSLAPRVYLPLEELTKSGLLKPGATGNYAYHFRLDKSDEKVLTQFKTSLYRQLTDPAIKVTLPKDSSEQTGRVITNVTNFMSLAALIGLVLALVGIFYLYQSHLYARLKDLSLLHLYGLSKNYLMVGIIGQFSLVFVSVAVVEIIFLHLLAPLLTPLLSQAVGLDLDGGFNLKFLFNQLPFLYALSLSILIPLLLGLIRTPLGVVLKSSKISMGSFRIFDFIPFVFFLWSYAWYLSNSLKTGNIFFLGLLIVFLMSTLIVKMIQNLLLKTIKGKGLLNPSLETGLALRNLTRSGQKLTLSFLSLALGATLISFIFQLELMIQKELTLEKKRPGLFIFDIQEEQIEDLTQFAKNRGTPLEAVTPMVRARLEEVNGKKFERAKTTLNLRENAEDDEENRMRNTGINLTYRDYLSPAEKITAGEPFKMNEIDFSGPAPVSLEKRWAQRMNLTIGDLVTFDVQGVKLEGKIQNIREVKWTSFYPNFFVSLAPGFLDGAPKTYLAVLGAGFKDKKVQFQRETVLNFPNISFIDVEELIAKLSALFDKSRIAIKIISFLSLGVGLVILYGLSHDQVYRRYYDLALLKTLGLTSKRLRIHLLIEFGSLFILAMSLGFFLGWLMAQIMGKEVFKLAISLDLSGVILPALLLTILCLATILISSWRAVQAKPRELLSDS